MPWPIYILVQFVLVFIEVLSIAMFIRVILSWFTDGSGKFSQFLYVLTEPAVMPMRLILAKLNWFQNTPIDFSFTFTFLALFIIETLLGLLLI